MQRSSVIVVTVICRRVCSPRKLLHSWRFRALCGALIWAAIGTPILGQRITLTLDDLTGNGFSARDIRVQVFAGNAKGSAVSIEVGALNVGAYAWKQVKLTCVALKLDAEISCGDGVLALDEKIPVKFKYVLKARHAGCNLVAVAGRELPHQRESLGGRQGRQRCACTVLWRAPDACRALVAQGRAEAHLGRIVRAPSIIWATDASPRISLLAIWRLPTHRACTPVKKSVLCLMHARNPQATVSHGVRRSPGPRAKYSGSLCTSRRKSST